MSTPIRRIQKLTLLMSLVAALDTVPPVHGGAVSGTLYFTRFSGSPRVNKVDFVYDGGTNFYLTNIVAIADLPGADGLVIAPNGDLIIGGQGNAVYEVDPVSGSAVTANAGGAQSFHMSLDPSRTKAWSGWGGSPLIEVPLNPFGNGLTHALSGDDTSVLTLAWDPAGNVYYTSSSGGLGVIDLTHFVTSRKLTPPADHGMAYDPFTGTLIISGGNHLSQISANPTNMQVISDLDLGTRGISVQFDQGTVDGQGHVFFADNNGKLVFVDYSASKLIGATNNFVAAPFLAPNLDDVAPIGLLGNTNTADLKLLLSAAANPAPVHTNLTLTLTVTNKGPDAATGVQLTTSVPENVTVVSITPSVGSVSNSNGNLLLTVGNLASQATASLTLVVRPVSGPFVLRGSVLANETDPFFFDNFNSLSVDAPYSCLEPPAGLVSWWPGDGNANDVAGTNHGTAFGLLTFVPGWVGEAFNLSSSTQYVAVPASPGLNVGLGNGLTVEAWIDPGNVGPEQPIAEWLRSGSFETHLWISVNGSGTLYANLMDTNGANHTITSAGNLITPNVFQHVALTYDKNSGVARLFRNGQIVAEQNLGTFTPRTDTDLYFGLRPSTGEHFNGLLDEVALYNRALSPDEVASLYFAGQAGKCGAPVIAPSPLPVAVTNLAYNVALTLAHATPAYHFVLLPDSGPLPAGITLSAAGLLSGTTTKAGNYPIHIQGTDASNQVAQVNLTLRVVTCAAPPLGLIGWWRAEGDASDAVGAHNGTTQNNVQFVAGKAGQAFSLDGNSAYIDLGPWSPGAQWSVEAWVNPAALPGGRRGILGGWAECRDWGLTMQDGQLGLTLRPPGGCSANILTGVQAVVGTWYHVVGTCDGATARLYVDGALVNSAPVDPNYIGTAQGTRIGGEVCCGNYFPGLIDEASIYDRPLTDAEVLALYTADAAGKCSGGQPPTIATPPQSEIVVAGTNAVFTVAAGGTGPFSYQWFFNQVPIPGATSATLTLSNLAGTEEGYYTVAVSNPAGTLISAPASLTILSLNLYAGITINGIVGRTYEIDYVTNLNNATWTPLTTFTLQNSPFLFIDTQSPTNARRFYRALLH